MSINQENLEKLGPRLRMICNGDEEVNALRSEISATVQVPAPVAERHKAKEMLQQAVKKPDVKEPPAAPPHDQPLPDTVKVSCFVRLTDPDAAAQVLPGNAIRRGDLVTAELTPREIEDIVNDPAARGIASIESGEPLSLPNPVISRRPLKEPASRVPTSIAGDTSGRPREYGDAPPVLIGLIDVGGFDFAHPDFLTPSGQTRFVSIWDQGAPKDSPLGPPPRPFTDGAEITGERMNKALEWGREHKVGATDLLQQSSQRPGAHGTHVASIAAGKFGVCPDAAIAGVVIALTEEDRERHGSLYDSTRLAHAIDYLFALGERVYKRRIPTVVNISLGTNGHAHDGTSSVCRWIDAALMTAGRCVCVAAGNAGQESPQFAGDLAFLMGRIHASGQVGARGLETDLEWQVVGNGITDVSENELEIWYEAGDEFEVRLRSPSGVWIGPVRPGSYVENRRLESETFVSIYSQQYSVANGANRIAIILSPRLKPPVVGIEAGTWLVRLRGIEVRDGRFDAWIERDDPRPLGRIGDVQAWRFPSYFSQRSNVDRSSVSSLACGHRVISVGNCEEAAERVNRSSSQGPTRDGRYKPEIAAPGTDIVAARGFAPRDRLWIAMSGTSMASPYVAGVAAQMLIREPRLTATQIVGIMRRTAQPLPGSDYRWHDAAGFGLIQPDACLAETHKPFLPIDQDHRP
jgi:subtilisin family serine protease